MTLVTTKAVSLASYIDPGFLAALAVGNFFIRGSMTQEQRDLIDEHDRRLEDAFLNGRLP